MKNKLFKSFFTLALSLVLVSTMSIPAFATSLNSVNYYCSNKVIHINNDRNLKNYLSEKRAGSLDVAKKSKKTYYYGYGRNINITDLSLAIEIVGHVWPDKIARYLPFGIGKGIIKHTSVIDCGEASVDSNRWVWDSIAVTVGTPVLLAVNSRSLNAYSNSSDKTSVEQRADAIIKNPKNKNLKLNRDIIIKVIEDIDNKTIDPILLEMANK